MKVLIVDTYYQAFLNSFYAKNPGLSHQPYEHQWRALMDQCFGTSDYYSTNLRQLGHEAMEVVANCWPLQQQWARDNGVLLSYKFKRRSYRGIPFPGLVKDWVYPILLAQVKKIKPDVIHFQDPKGTNSAFLQEIRPYARVITGQVASSIPQEVDFSGYDLMLSSFPHFVQRFKKRGLCSTYFNLGFEPRVLAHLKRTKSYDVVFVGGLSRSHAERITFLEQVVQGAQVVWWGYGVENLRPNSPLRAVYQGPAWALEMYEKLFNARIALNHHIDVAEKYANNMRLYEGTGVGSLLITDFKDNLHRLFEPGKEVVSYHSPEECLELIYYYLEHDPERQAIARAGQQRTLRDHTYYHRMEEFIELVKPLLA